MKLKNQIVIQFVKNLMQWVKMNTGIVNAQGQTVERLDTLGIIAQIQTSGTLFGTDVISFAIKSNLTYLCYFFCWSTRNRFDCDF